MEPVNYNQLSTRKRKQVRQQYIAYQENKCHYCGESLYGPPSAEVKNLPVNKHSFPPNFFDYPIHLHHDHNTGMTIGAVHAHCNAVLWAYHGE